MVLAYHVVFGCYGFWLPNDPRGSWSAFVGSWELFRFGKATKVNTPRSLASVPHDQARRRAAKETLTFPAVRLTGPQARAVGRGFDQARTEAGYTIHACSVLPEHVHLVVGRHRRAIGRIMGHVKTRATQHLKSEGLWRHGGRSPWAERGWKVFLDRPEDVLRAIDYVRRNPQREGLPAQRWWFVTPFEACPQRGE